MLLKLYFLINTIIFHALDLLTDSLETRMKFELFRTLINSVSSLYRSNQAKHFSKKKHTVSEMMYVTHLMITHLLSITRIRIIIIDFEMMTHSDGD